MMRRVTIILLLFGMLVVSGCNLLPGSETPTENQKAVETQIAQPTASDIPTEIPTAVPPEPTPIPTTQPVPSGAPQMILPQNASRLVETSKVDVPMPYRLIWSQDSSRLAVLSQNGLVLLDGNTLDTLANVQIQDPYFLLSFSPETNLLAVTSDRKTVELRDALTGEVVKTIERPNQAYFAEFSPDGQTLGIGTTDQLAVELWDVNSAVLKQTLSGFTTAAPVYGAIFSADGKFLIWLARASVQVTHIASGQLGPLLSHEDFVGGLALAPDDRLLAAGSVAYLGEDYTPIVQLWDSNSGQGVGRLVTPNGLPVSVSFSPDGSLLASSSSSLVTIWDVATQQEVTRLTGFGDAVNASVFAPDGKKLAISSSDGTVRLWQVLE